MFTTILLFLVGSIFAISGYFLKTRNKKLQSLGKRTRAQIIGYEKRSDSDGSSMYHPQIKFHAQGNELIIKMLDSSTSWKPKKALPAYQ